MENGGWRVTSGFLFYVASMLYKYTFHVQHPMAKGYMLRILTYIPNTIGLSELANVATYNE